MKGKYLAADPATMQTALPGVFAAGDAVTGPDAAIRAIAGGRAAALAIGQYLRGARIDLGPQKPFSAVKGGIAKEDLCATEARREPMPVLPLPRGSGAGTSPRSSSATTPRPPGGGAPLPRVRVRQAARLRPAARRDRPPGAAGARTTPRCGTTP